MAKIMPTAPRYRWEVTDPVHLRKLQQVLNEHSEEGWSLYTMIRCRGIEGVYCIFRRVEHIGEEDRVEKLLEDNNDLPFQRVND